MLTYLLGILVGNLVETTLSLHTEMVLCYILEVWPQDSCACAEFVPLVGQDKQEGHSNGRALESSSILPFPPTLEDFLQENIPLVPHPEKEQMRDWYPAFS